MDRIVAIVLGLLVIVIGFVIVQNIADGQGGIGDTGSNVECLVHQGTCVNDCEGEELTYTCAEGLVCCKK